MNVTGKVVKKDEKWFLDGWDGKTYELRGFEMKPRMEGLTVRVVGTLEDTFGLGMFEEDLVMNVQRLRVT